MTPLCGIRPGLLLIQEGRLCFVRLSDEQDTTCTFLFLFEPSGECVATRRTPNTLASYWWPRIPNPSFPKLPPPRAAHGEEIEMFGNQVGP